RVHARVRGHHLLAAASTHQDGAGVARDDPQLHRRARARPAAQLLTGGGMAGVEGVVADGFGPVRDAFQANFAERGEVGAAVGVSRDGRRVGAVGGGVADPASGRPWSADTLVLVYSMTKGASTVCAHRLVEQGRLDLDAPVAAYWPEFGANGKAEIPVRWL